MPKYQNQFILIGILAGILGFLDYIGMISFPVALFGVSGFYIGVAFFAAFAIWFKWRALVAIYLGMTIGQLLAGVFAPHLLLVFWGNIIGASIPMLVFNSKSLKLNKDLKAKKDYAAFFLSAVILQVVVSGTITMGMTYLMGLIPYQGLMLALYTWFVSDAIIMIVIGIPLLKYVSPVVMKSSVY